MQDATNTDLHKAEVEKRWIEVAQQSRAHYRAIGLHITQEEFSQWVGDLKNNLNAPMPVCHK
jgi:hypothetical protein